MRRCLLRLVVWPFFLVATVHKVNLILTKYQVTLSSVVLVIQGNTYVNCSLFTVVNKDSYNFNHSFLFLFIEVTKRLFSRSDLYQAYVFTWYAWIWPIFLKHFVLRWKHLYLTLICYQGDFPHTVHTYTFWYTQKNLKDTKILALLNKIMTLLMFFVLVNYIVFIFEFRTSAECVFFSYYRMVANTNLQ